MNQQKTLSLRRLSSGPPTIVRKQGGVRGGVLGFLLGVSLTGSAAGVYLLDSYSSSSQSLVGAMDQLKATVCQVKGAVAKMDTLESGVNDLQESKASLLDLEKRRQELLKVIDSVHLEHLELKSQVWDLKDQLEALRKDLKERQ